jgi:anti-sigma B factor antagonist
MATLTLDKETRNGVHILHARGRITLGDGSLLLRDSVKSSLAEGAVRIVLDLGEVSYMDSSGLGELVSAYTSVTSQGGKIVFAGLQKRISELLQITKLYTVFEVYDTVDLAIAALSRPAEA